MPKPNETNRSNTQLTPDPMLEKRTRRQFSTEYKLRIIAQADQCRHGEFGALLRRENLYSNQLRDWRKQLSEGGDQALSKTAPGAATQAQRREKRARQATP